MNPPKLCVQNHAAARTHSLLQLQLSRHASAAGGFRWLCCAFHLIHARCSHAMFFDVCMACRHEYNLGGLLDEAVRSMEELKHGCRVRIHGLIDAPQHNGKQGVTISFDEERERWSVEVGEPELLAVNPANLVVERETMQNEPSGLQDAQIRDYIASLCPLQDGAILRGDRYTLCPDCTLNEAAGRYGERAMCRNAAMRLIDPNMSFSQGNIMLVCCATNQLARNQNHEAPNVKHQI